MLTDLRWVCSIERRWAAVAMIVAATLLAVSCLSVSDEGLGRSRSSRADLAPYVDSADVDPSHRPVPGWIILTQVPANQRSDESRPAGARPWPAALPHGSRILAIDRSTGDAKSINLTSEFAAAGRPDVSFDGERILFVARRAPQDRTSVWEMRLDGSDVREVVLPGGDCESAIYLSTIFTLNAEKPEYQLAFVARRPEDARLSLYTCRMDGSNVRRITFTPPGVSDPLLLSDGRLVFSMAFGDESASDSAEDSRSTALFTINTDGTDVFPFAGLHEPPARRGAPCETDDGRIVYVEADSAGWANGGSLVSVGRTRSLKTRGPIDAGARGEYRTPSALANGNLLVSFRPADKGTDGTYGVYELDPKSGRRVAVLLDDPDWHELDAVVVRPRPEPPGRSTVVGDAGDVGQLYCMDARISDVPGGRSADRGMIARVRVTAGRRGGVFAAGVSGVGGRIQGQALATPEDAIVLGEASVESDGSFFLDVPARTPLRLETLDESGRVLDSMRSWIWVMPVERRGCIGCHEDRELTPPNRHVFALRKPPQPIGVEPRKPERTQRSRYEPKEP